MPIFIQPAFVVPHQHSECMQYWGPQAFRFALHLDLVFVIREAGVRQERCPPPPLHCSPSSAALPLPGGTDPMSMLGREEQYLWSWPASRRCDPPGRRSSAGPRPGHAPPGHPPGPAAAAHAAGWRAWPTLWMSRSSSGATAAASSSAAPGGRANQARPPSASLHTTFPLSWARLPPPALSHGRVVWI